MYKPVENLLLENAKFVQKRYQEQGRGKSKKKNHETTM